MQEMTPEICASAKENDTTRLEDARDGKLYWVAKLKDGNCWMTQNLELDLGGRTLTPQDSDVSADWNYDAAGGDVYTEINSNNIAPISSWQLRDAVQQTPSSDNALYWQDISSGWTPMIEYRTDGVTYDETTKTYDAHYLAGYYYSLRAATADTLENASTQGEKIQDSICPAGWELPTAGVKEGDFYDLLVVAYGITSNDNDKLSRAPVFFFNAGSIYIDARLGPMEDKQTGKYFSSISAGAGSAYVISMYSSYNSVDSFSIIDNNRLGTVRCISTEH